MEDYFRISDFCGPLRISELYEQKCFEVCTKISLIAPSNMHEDLNFTSGDSCHSSISVPDISSALCNAAPLFAYCTI